MLWKLNILSNDAKRMITVADLDFAPYPGLTLRGYAGDHELRISAVIHDKDMQGFRVALVWLSADPAESWQLEELGWAKV